MEFVNKYCETVNDLQISNKINVDKHTINNSSCTELFQIIQHFSKINMKEVEPSIKNINETIFEGDLILIVDELVNLIFKEMNEEKDYKIIKKHVYNYINNHETNSQEIYNCILNNQNDSNNSIYLLGYFNYHGIETNINKQKAFKLYEKAAELENIAAQFSFINICIYEKGNEKYHIKAFELSEKLAEGVNPSALNTLGYCYENGVGTDIDEQKAFELYQKSADLGNSNGINNLGWCYDSGFGTDSNKKKAFELYQKAANLGNCLAQYNIALMHEKGEGTENDIDKAIYWYGKSAAQGDPVAQNKLFNLLEE
ncbi:uncharacterized protein OCT59_023434 [Rhizophagus irregularis]|nr:hypothetical protein OCT59_023434 [Rhizophagus irregularis]